MSTPLSPQTETARTREAEARRVIDIVAEHVEDGTSVSDIAVVVPDLSRYEADLADAADAYDLPIAAWTQLPLTDTLPYRLTIAICRTLGDEPCTLETLLAPLTYEWVHPEEDAIGPVATKTIAALRRTLADGEHPLTEWNDQIAQADPPESVMQYLGWIASHRQGPPPTPQTVQRTLSQVIDAYEFRVLPRRHDRDDDTLSDTARTARAVVRMRDLIQQIVTKYETRLDEGEEPSWHTVVQIAEAIAGYRAGRREHANARALDVIEANDTWGLSRPVIIIVGLRDGEWLQPQPSVLTDALAQEIMGGAGEMATLSPRATWSEAGVRDQFADAIAAATETLVCTRHRLDADGTACPPSPLLTDVQTEASDFSPQ